VPVLRREMDALRPARVPEAPTHASLVLAAERSAQTDTADAPDTAAQLTSAGRAA
jgi:hypothetical protein